jgi:hypothetical protein
MRECLCADPQNCTEAVPGYRCKAGRSVLSIPATCPDCGAGHSAPGWSVVHDCTQLTGQAHANNACVSVQSQSQSASEAGK